VAVGPVAAHLASITGAGFSPASIAECASVSRQAVNAILNGTTKGVRRSKASAFLAVTPQRIFAEVDDLTRVPVYGMRRRLQALIAIGWRSRDVTAASSVTRTRALNQDVTVFASVHRAVAELYDSLCLTDGPSNRSRMLAARHAWCAPLEWDDIDDPQEDPRTITDATVIDMVAVERALAGHSHVELTAEEVAEAVRIGATRGMSARDIGERLGLKPDTVQQRIVRGGLRSAA
jgi:DNA-binding CsgD family transcriptional regulator